MLTNLWIYLGVVAAILLANLLLSLVTAMQVRRLSRNADESDDTDLASILREEFRLNRTEAAEAAKRLREEVAKAQKDGNDAMIAAVKDLGKLQQESLNGVEKRVKELVDSNEARQEKLRETVNTQLKQIQDSNEKKLEQMRVTVDEKLQSTLEKRLGESFKLVSERLESVQKGLGEMQNLASGVGDLKRVLTNV
ncbi:MAG: DNA recombination protein RmuC, partial [Pseudomonadales bacterium]